LPLQQRDQPLAARRAAVLGDDDRGRRIVSEACEHGADRAQSSPRRADDQELVVHVIRR
jgi:hypothetical protein